MSSGRARFRDAGAGGLRLNCRKRRAQRRISVSSSTTKTPMGFLPANSRLGGCATSRGTWRRVWTPYSRAALRPCTGRSFVRSIAYEADGTSASAPCAVVLRHGAWTWSLQRDHVSGGGRPVGGRSRGDAANRAGDEACLAQCPDGACKQRKRLRATTRGTQHSRVSTWGEHSPLCYRRCFSCSDAAARAPRSRLGGKRAHSELITHTRSSASSRVCRVWNYLSALDAGASGANRHRQVPMHKDDSLTRSTPLRSGNRGA